MRACGARTSKLGFHVGGADSERARVPMTRRLLPVPATLIAGALALATPASVAPDAAAATPAPVSVAVVMPLTVPPTADGLIDEGTLVTYTQPDGLLDRELDAVAGTRAAVGLDPMIPASIRILGSAVPPDALAFLERLRDMPNEVFLLGYADADPALAVAAGMTGQTAPLGFDFAIDPADFGPAQTPTATPGSSPAAGPPESPTPGPTDEPDDGPPPLPGTDDLLAWPTTLPSIAWPAEGTVSSEVLAGLSGLDFDAVLVGESNVSGTTGARVALGDIDGLVIDAAVSDSVRDAVHAMSETQFEGALADLGDTLRAAAAASPGRTLIATLERRRPVADMRLARVLDAIAAGTSSQLVDLSGVLAGGRGTATLVEPDQAPAHAAMLHDLAQAARDEASYLRIADDASPITQPRRLALLGLSAVGWGPGQVGWETAATEQRDAARATLDAVQIVEGSDQLLLSDISSLRLPVSNSLPVAVTVRLNVRPLRPLLHIEDPTVEVTVEPESTATATVPVQAIINGDLVVRAELRDSANGSVGSPRLLKVIVQAGWETVGTLVAGALILLIFGGGLVRAVLRRRRAATDSATRAGGDG